MKGETTNRNRSIQLKIYVDEEEMEKINSNMERAKIKKRSDYIRQMCVFGKIISYDDLYLKKCFNELNKIGVNLNQIAKVANRTDSIYAEDIQLLMQGYSSVSNVLEEIYLKIEKLIDTAEKAEFETLTEQINKAVEKLHQEGYL